MLQPAAPASRPLLLLGVWCALVAGLLEAGWLEASIAFLDKEIGLGRSVVWMAPVAHLLLFGAIGLALTLLARRRPDHRWLWIAAFVYVALGAFSLFLAFERIHPLAMMVLALGLAARASALIAAHPDGFLRVVRRTTAPLLAVVLALAIAVPVRAWWRERRALAALPEPTAGMPNILLLLLDTVRARSLSLYGYGRPTTPNLERLARRGVVFDWAIAPSPWTLPSHASMFTGRFPLEMSTSWRVPLDATDSTLAEILARRGYRTGGFAANLYYTSYEFGLDRGFSHYEDYTNRPSELLLATGLGRTLASEGQLRRVVRHYDNIGRKSAARINGEFLRWLPQSSDRPFFAFLNYFDAHEPYLPPTPFDTLFGPRGPRELHLLHRLEKRNGIRWQRQRMPEAEKTAERNAYDGAIAYLDSQIGALLDSLDARGALANTIVIVTADHGEALGERGIWGHGESLHMPELHIPLLVVAPGRAPAGVRVRRTVSLRDLGATLHALLGLDQDRFPGRSFASAWRDSSAAGRSWADTVYAEFHEKGMRSLIAGAHHYIIEPSQREELFDLSTDPTEGRDLAPSDSGRLLRQPLKDAVIAQIGAMRRRR